MSGLIFTQCVLSISVFLKNTMQINQNNSPKMLARMIVVDLLSLLFINLCSLAFVERVRVKKVVAGWRGGQHNIKYQMETCSMNTMKSFNLSAWLQKKWQWRADQSNTYIRMTCCKELAPAKWIKCIILPFHYGDGELK